MYATLVIRLASLIWPAGGVEGLAVAGGGFGGSAEARRRGDMPRGRGVRDTEAGRQRQGDMDTERHGDKQARNKATGL